MGEKYLVDTNNFRLNLFSLWKLIVFIINVYLY